MATVSFVLLVLAALTSLACMLLLWRAYRRTGLRLLLWSALCFVGLSVSNVLLFFDLAVYPVEVDLRPWRSGAALAGLLFLLYGFIGEAE
jgi:Na+/melibiose symporter-like transporter